MARILVVDADVRERTACARDLELDGHDVLTAPTGFDALRLAEEHVPEIVITEVRLPGMDGLDLMCRLLSRVPRPIVILHSRSSWHRDSFLSWAADADLTKADDTSELRAKVRELLESAEEDRRAVNASSCAAAALALTHTTTVG